MIGVLLAVDDAAGREHLARCLALPNANPAQCDVEVSDHMVDGRYCSGNVRLFLDANGKRAVECIPQAVVDRKLEAQAKDPLPSPSSPAVTTLAPFGTPAKAIGLGAVALGLIYLALR